VTARTGFVLATALCATLGGWAAVVVLALCRVGARWHPQEVGR
jgi:uncharacterized membrane protein